MAQGDDRLFIAIGGHAVALDPSTGTEIWRTKLKVSSFVTVWFSGTRLFAGAGGELFCLDPGSGAILWRNKLKGLGMGVVAFTTSSGIVVDAAAEARRQAARAAAAS